MSKYRIVSLDGGGIRGLMMAIFLQEIARRFSSEKEQDFLGSIDFLAGTSTGGILALAIAQGIDLNRIKTLYLEKSRKIFRYSAGNLCMDGYGLCTAKYAISPLRRELDSIFQETLLKELGKKVLIPTFDLDNDPQNSCEYPPHEPRRWKPKLFHNFDDADADSQKKVVDVGVYTAAAPTFFPAVDGYIDGGVYANNPAMCALAHARNKRYGRKVDFEDIVMLSLGTGQNLKHLGNSLIKRGGIQWAHHLIPLMFDGATDIVDYQCQHLLGEARYCRLNPSFGPDLTIQMDEVDKLYELYTFAKDYLDTAEFESMVQWISDNWF